MREQAQELPTSAAVVAETPVVDIVETSCAAGTERLELPVLQVCLLLEG